MVYYLQLMNDLKLMNLIFENHDILHDNELKSVYLTK